MRHRYGACTSECSKLLHNDTQFLLALALADNAFFGIESPEKLWTIRIPEGKDHVQLLWREDVKDLPILRKANKNGAVSSKSMSRSQFDEIIKDVLGRAGFFEKPTIHAIRRALGAKINGRLLYHASNLLTYRDTERYTEAQQF